MLLGLFLILPHSDWNELTMLDRQSRQEEGLFFQGKAHRLWHLQTRFVLYFYFQERLRDLGHTDTVQIIAFSLQNLLISDHSCSFLQPKLPQAPNTLITNFNFNHGIISRAVIYTNLRVLIQLPFIFDRHHFDVVNEIGKF